MLRTLFGMAYSRAMRLYFKSDFHISVLPLLFGVGVIAGDIVVLIAH